MEPSGSQFTRERIVVEGSLLEVPPMRPHVVGVIAQLQRNYLTCRGHGLITNHSEPVPEGIEMSRQSVMTDY